MHISFSVSNQQQVPVLLLLKLSNNFCTGDSTGNLPDAFRNYSLVWFGFFFLIGGVELIKCTQHGVIDGLTSI